MRSRAVSLPASCWRSQALLAAAELGAAFEVGEDVVWSVHRVSFQPSLAASYALTACDFSQSFRNFSRPMLVSGWLNS